MRDLSATHPVAAQVVLIVYAVFLVGAGIYMAIQLWRRK